MTGSLRSNLLGVMRKIVGEASRPRACGATVRTYRTNLADLRHDANLRHRMKLHPMRVILIADKGADHLDVAAHRRQLERVRVAARARGDGVGLRRLPIADNFEDQIAALLRVVAAI